MRKISFFVLLVISTLIFMIVANISKPIDKQEIIEMAKNQGCSLKLSLIHVRDFNYFEECISIIGKHHFREFSLVDKKDIAINFILHSDLDGGRSVAFIEMIAPYKNELIKSLEDISDLALKQQYQASEIDINRYRQKIEYYAKALAVSRKTQ
jgi:hypothetical protein